MNVPLMVALGHVNKTVPMLLDHTFAAVIQDIFLEPIRVHVLVRYFIVYSAYWLNNCRACDAYNSQTLCLHIQILMNAFLMVV